ncbi:MAG: hypothetical protein P4L50_04395 [Anaerolineaceae bacterium]|nr:hypothetical protein [Anaerolineaceae bacterium]
MDIHMTTQALDLVKFYLISKDEFIRQFTESIYKKVVELFSLLKTRIIEKKDDEAINISKNFEINPTRYLQPFAERLDELAEKDAIILYLLTELQQLNPQPINVSDYKTTIKTSAATDVSGDSNEVNIIQTSNIGNSKEDVEEEKKNRR